MPKRYTSGQFATLCHTTKETLRHYDELGLLKPQNVGENGYHYYDSKQFLQFEMICFLKETGMPLREIAAFLRQKRQADTIAVLKDKARALHKEQERLAQQESFVQALLDIAHECETTPLDRLVLRTLEQRNWELSDTFDGLDTTEGMSLACAHFQENTGPRQDTLLFPPVFSLPGKTFPPVLSIGATSLSPPLRPLRQQDNT